MSGPSLDIERWLDQAERDYLLEGKWEYRFRLRGAAIRARADQELRRYPFLKVTSFRTDREGFTSVGRPFEVGLALEDLIRLRPGLPDRKAAWTAAERELAGCLDWPEFARANYSECQKKADLLPAVARVLRYLCENRETVRGLYPRQVPHGQSTKLIGYEPLLLRAYSAWSAKPSPEWDDLYADFALKRRPVGFPFAADLLRWDGVEVRDLRALLDEDNIPRWDLSRLQKVLIVENEESFFPLCGQLPGTLLIHGRGKTVSRLAFLRPHLPPGVRAFYWGDMDKEGYEILSQTAQALGQITPLGMDGDTMSRAWHLRQPRDPAEPMMRAVPLLEDEYRRVCREGFQIEQEQLGIDELLQEWARQFPWTVK